MKGIYYVLLVSLFISSCYDSDEDIHEKGREILSFHESDLDEIAPILANYFDDTCNIFFLEMSPTTDLFYIEDLNKNNKVQLSDSVVSIIRIKKPRLKLVNIAYRPDNFIAFSIQGTHHRQMCRSYLVKALGTHNMDSFKSSFQKINNEVENSFKKLNDDWFTCTVPMSKLVLNCGE